MKWNEKTKAFFAEELAKLIRGYVERTVYPVAEKQTATVEVLNALRGRVDELEARLAEIEAKPTLRRIA